MKLSKEQRKIINDRYRQRYKEDLEFRRRVLDGFKRRYHAKYKLDPEFMKKQSVEGINRRRVIKLEVIDYYSEGLNKCSCCNDSHIEFLTIHHVNGRGRIHRISVVSAIGSSTAFYRWLLKNKPSRDEFKVLCVNCNLSLGSYGYCPHKTEIHPITRMSKI